ncbi:hypothetical protein N0K08_21900 [Acidovorax sp. Be4]|uniref:Uncharacterized protein n=1 Tax=Acidovorax bellezanensis TaxID=2976702 RepID=A0ABT2PVW6_9BURK|nr:hypothetical protein [Acidovorax sp. Be4]MCT9813293.1 hypothetical protein [Acidovorax sp. Be4]
MNIGSIGTANTATTFEVSSKTSSMDATQDKAMLRSLVLEDALSAQVKSLTDLTKLSSSTGAGSSQPLNVGERLRTIMDEPYIDDCMMRYGNHEKLHRLEMESGVLEDRCSELKQEISKKMPAGAERDLALAKVDDFLKASLASSKKQIDATEKKIRDGNEQNLPNLDRTHRTQITRPVRELRPEDNDTDQNDIPAEKMRASLLGKMSAAQLNEISEKIQITNALSDYW